MTITQKISSAFVSAGVLFLGFNSQPAPLIYENVLEKPVIQVSEAESLRPELIPICACESVGAHDREPRHYQEDGETVIRGIINPQDIGICQINLVYHWETAYQMGLDIFIKEDNIKFANWLYKQEGMNPWLASQECWDYDT